jgi:hypothetical protein
MLNLNTPTVYVKVRPQSGGRGVIFVVFKGEHKSESMEMFREFGQKGQKHIDRYLDKLRSRGYAPVLHTRKPKQKLRQTFGGDNLHGGPIGKGRRSSKKVDDRHTSTSDLTIVNSDGAWKPGASYLVPKNTRG